VSIASGARAFIDARFSPCGVHGLGARRTSLGRQGRRGFVYRLLGGLCSLVHRSGSLGSLAVRALYRRVGEQTSANRDRVVPWGVAHAIR
jgi:hypothetical protein